MIVSNIIIIIIDDGVGVVVEVVPVQYFYCYYCYHYQYFSAYTERVFFLYLQIIWSSALRLA